jgi:hypothetical protein
MRGRSNTSYVKGIPMVKVTSANRLQLAAAAAAVIVAGLLTAPSAAASPVFPLAPACDGYKLSGFTNFISASRTIFIGWSPDGKSGRANYGGYGGNGSMADVTGGLNGRHVEFLVHFDQGPEAPNKWQYSGDVGDDLSLAGTLHAPGVTEAWHSDAPVECVAPKPDTGPAAGQKTATVVQATDIYDKPDGKGQKIGTLYSGEVHPLMEPCRDDWCRVGQIELGGFPGLPNGTAWVYAKGYLTFSN